MRILFAILLLAGCSADNSDDFATQLGSTWEPLSLGWIPMKPIGEVLDSWNGPWGRLDAISLGPNPNSYEAPGGIGYSLRGQCVDLSNRFFLENVYHAGAGSPQEIYGNGGSSRCSDAASRSGYYEVYWPNSGYEPVVGDDVEWLGSGGGAGHSAIVIGIDSGYIVFIQQNARYCTNPVNRSCSYDNEAFPFGRTLWNGRSYNGEACVIHAKGNHGTGSGGGGATGGPQCVNNPGTGNNCGDEPVISGGDAATLYHCNGAGSAGVVDKCQYGCQHNRVGTPDVCKTAPPPPPPPPPIGITCVNNPGTGDNCGDESVISGGDKNTLYHCAGAGAATEIVTCTHGCVHQPPGIPDTCAATCVNNPGTGNNCGDQNVINGGRGNTLYHCNGAGAASILAVCTNGCKHNPPGVNDACN